MFLVHSKSVASGSRVSLTVITVRSTVVSFWAFLWPLIWKASCVRRVRLLTKVNKERKISFGFLGCKVLGSASASVKCTVSLLAAAKAGDHGAIRKCPHVTRKLCKVYS